jgi:hypothetical protein
VAFADGEVVEVVGRRDFHRARSLLGVRVRIGDHGDRAIDHRQNHATPDEILVARIVGVHRDGAVGEQRLGRVVATTTKRPGSPSTR